MNREIKFRGWERELQMMVYDTELGGWDFEYDGNPVRAVNQMINEDDYFYDLMQFTGLRDEDGTEIYEGDIVEVDGEKSVIESVPGGFTVASLPLVEVSNYGMKVIGNIYEHPELLECDRE